MFNVYIYMHYMYKNTTTHFMCNIEVHNICKLHVHSVWFFSVIVIPFYVLCASSKSFVQMYMYPLFDKSIFCI